MNIEFGLIPKETIPLAKDAAVRLEKALKEGRIHTVKEEKARLLSFVLESVTIPEDEWRCFLAKVRAVSPEFKADYLLSGEKLYADASGENTGLSNLFTNAREQGALVLELPVDDDSAGDDDDKP
jgi:hypothetical protein